MGSVWRSSRPLQSRPPRSHRIRLALEYRNKAAASVTPQVARAGAPSPPQGAPYPARWVLLGDGAIKAFRIDVSFDEEILKYAGFSPGPVMDSLLVDTIEAEPGRERLEIARDGNGEEDEWEGRNRAAQGLSCA